MTQESISLYTTCWGEYWEKYGEAWCSDMNNLNKIPDEIIIVSDRKVSTSLLKHKNVKNIIVPIVDGKRTLPDYRNHAIKNAKFSWVVSTDLDDRYPKSFLDNIPDGSDIHAFSFKDISSGKYYYPDKSSLLKRLQGVVDQNLISSVTAIKKHVFESIRYELGCFEDQVFYSMASSLGLTVTSDDNDKSPRFIYSGPHGSLSDPEFERVSSIYSNILQKKTMPVYAFWFSSFKSMSKNRKIALSTLKKYCKDLIFLNEEGFFKYENSEIPIHKGFIYLTDNHKSDYARAYMMYFYGGGYSDIKPNKFYWDAYFEKLFLSNADAIGYAEQSFDDIAQFYKNSDTGLIGKNYNKFLGNGHYIFKPKTYTAYRWLMEIHKLMDERYEDLLKNPGVMVHISDPNYSQIIGDYPFEWNELAGRIFHKMQYEDNFENTMVSMPHTNNVDYL